MSKNDNKILAIDHIEKKNTTFSKYIRSFYSIDSYGNKRESKINIELIAKKLGFGKDSLKKIINLQRPTHNRDIIIAICAVLGLDSGETGDALHLYIDMPSLDPDVLRESEIARVLDSDSEDKLNYILQQLEEKNLKQLDIPIAYNKNYPHASEYTIVHQCIDSGIEYLMNDSYFGEEERYNLNHYLFDGRMIIENKQTRKKVELISNGKKRLVNPIPFSYDEYKILNLNVSPYNSFFEIIEQDVEKEFKKLAQIANDTRNYKLRVWVKNIHGKLSFFLEEFNYQIPELNQYYVALYDENGFEFSCVTSSKFMWYVLDREEYQNVYGNYKGKTLIKISSITEFEELIQNSNNDYDLEFLLKMWRSAYIRTKDKLYDYIRLIKNGKIKIRDIDTIYDNEIDQVFLFYKLDKEFDCYDENGQEDDDFIYSFYCAHRDEVVLQYHNENLLLKKEDIYKAFELGFNTKEEIFDTVSQYGSITSMINQYLNL